MSVTCFENEKIFMLQGKTTPYAIGVTNKGWVCNLHWGGKDYGVFSGNGLMNSGLPIWVKGTARSEILVIEEV